MLRSNAEKTEFISLTSRFTETRNIEKLSFANIVIELTEKKFQSGSQNWRISLETLNIAYYKLCWYRITAKESQLATANGSETDQPRHYNSEIPSESVYVKEFIE